MVETLNSMFSASEFAATSFDGNPTLSQNLCLARLKSAVLNLGKPPEDLNGQGALSELRVKLGYSGEPASLAGYQKDLISLPCAGDVPSPLDVILGHRAESVVGTLRQKLLSQGVVDARKGESSLKALYVDPIFRRQRSVYAEFISRLHASNLVEFRTEARERVGVFFVWKKSGKQRMVVDSRLANLWFDCPEKVHLATGTAFSRLEVDEGPPIEVGGVDIKDAFYRIELPSEFRDLFALSHLPAKILDPGMLAGLDVSPDQLIFPCFRVVPMGWTQALWVCQKCHECVTDDLSVIPPSLRLSDMRPVPSMQPFVHAEYVDNFICLSQQAGLVSDLAGVVEKELNRRGLPTHPVEADTGGETLGWYFDSKKASVAMTPRRLWKLKMAIDELLRQGWGSGQLVERIVGHCTFAALLRREILSCFQAVYVFTRKRYHVHSRLWPEVARELRWVSSLLPLVQRDLSAEWSTDVYAVDASTWGRGVVAAKADRDLVRDQARHLDRCRFTATQEHQVQKSEIVGAGNFSDILDFEIENQNRKTNPIPEVDPKLLQLDWKKVHSSPWTRPEAIPVLEGRALVWVAQHLARSQVNHGKRHLLLSDSMTAILALTKGRGNSRSMNRVCRQVGALSLACGFQLNYRWVASELNAADKPSRNRNVDFDFAIALQCLFSGDAGQKSQSWRRQAADYYQKLYESTGGQICRQPSPAAAHRKDCKRKASDQGPTQTAEIWAAECGHADQCAQYDDPGDDERFKKPERILCPSMGGFQRVREDVQAPGEDLRRFRRSSSLVDRPLVLSRGECGISDDLHGSSQAFPKRSCAHVRSAPGNTCFQGFQEVGARTSSGSNSLPNVSLDSPADFGVEKAIGCMPLAAADVASLCSSGRSFQTSVETHGGPKSDQSVLVSSDVPLVRGRGCLNAIKGRGNRRKCDSQCEFPAVDEPLVAELEAEVGRQRLRVSLPAQHRQSALHGSRPRTWVSKTSSLHIPGSAWSSLDGSLVSGEGIGGCHEKGAMENLGVGAAVRTRRQTRSGLRIVVQGNPKQVLRRRGQISTVNAHLRWLQEAPESSLFLEIFSGSGNLSRALCRSFRGNLTVVSIDIVHGAEHDLEKRRIQQYVTAAIRTGKVVGVWLGTPFTSWSQARRNDGSGPSPLRSDTLLRGLPGLSLKDQARVKTGNCLADFSAHVFEICEKMGIPVCLENPATSRLWLLPRLSKLKAKSSVQFLSTDYCQDGKPWRHRTSLMSSNVDLASCIRVCHSKKGICSRTGSSHVQLGGQQSGNFLTFHAQPYPAALCKRVANAFERAIFEYRARPYMQLLFPSSPGT
jgi:hypothetical protein